jgi:competence protein ComEA
MSAATPRAPWGWTPQVRNILAAAASLGAIALALQAPTSSARPREVPGLVLELNSAPPQALAALPKLGPALVARIVEVRRQAPFESLEDLDRRVRGIGPATIAALRPYLRVARPPAHPHRASRSGLDKY